MSLVGIFGILFILSGYQESFVNPGEYPQSQETPLLDLPKIQTRYCGLSDQNSCSKCNYLKKKKSIYAQKTNNDKTIWDGGDNLELSMYKRTTLAPPKPIEKIGEGLRINMFSSIC
tara:strand:- start:230 stop:577 length:348 start_codon:yes stop_codon:yes gene_type:complete